MKYLNRSYDGKVASDLVIVQSDVKTLQSDLVGVIQSDLNVVLSNLVNDIQSDLNVVLSNLVADVQSDINSLASDIVATTNSDIVVVQSDLKVADALIDTIKSDLIISQSDVKTLQSDLTKTRSDMLITHSDVKAVNSDIKVLDPIIDTIKSDLIITQSDVKTLQSDLTIDRTGIGTEFSIKKSIADKTTITQAGLLLTVASSGGELILKRFTLQNDGTVTGGNTGGAIVYSDDATFPLNYSLTNGVFAASGFYGLDINYPIQTGKKVGIKAVTGDCTGVGSLIITMTFTRNANGATIAAV